MGQAAKESHAKLEQQSTQTIKELEAKLSELTTTTQAQKESIDKLNSQLRVIKGAWNASKAEEGARSDEVASLKAQAESSKAAADAAQKEKMIVEIRQKRQAEAVATLEARVQELTTSNKSMLDSEIAVSLVPPTRTLRRTARDCRLAKRPNRRQRTARRSWRRSAGRRRR